MWKFKMAPPLAILTVLHMKDYLVTSAVNTKDIILFMRV